MFQGFPSLLCNLVESLVKSVSAIVFNLYYELGFSDVCTLDVTFFSVEVKKKLREIFFM